MAFFKSLPPNGNPMHIYTKYPEIYGPWTEMGGAMMNGPSPLSEGEREIILAYAAGVVNCKFVYVAHSEVAYAWGLERGALDRLLENPDTAPFDTRLKALLAFVRKLMLTPNQMSQGDVDAVLAAGWDEKALHDAIAITARAAFMQRLVEGHGCTPMTQEVAAQRAQERLKHGYGNLYPSLRKDKDK